jgi:hypothetical protein
MVCGPSGAADTGVRKAAATSAAAPRIIFVNIYHALQVEGADLPTASMQVGPELNHNRPFTRRSNQNLAFHPTWRSKPRVRIVPATTAGVRPGGKRDRR